MARPTLFGHRKLKKLGTRLKSKALAIGHLELIWNAANETGNPILGDADDVEAAAEWQGVRGELVAALLECGTLGRPGFLEQLADGRYVIHDYGHHAPEYANERRAKEDERQREKVCDNCSRGYFSTDPRSRFCSSTCRSRHWRNAPESPTGANGSATDATHANADCNGSPSQSSQSPLQGVSGEVGANASGNEHPSHATQVRHDATERNANTPNATLQNGALARAPAPARLSEEDSEESTHSHSAREAPPTEVPRETSAEPGSATEGNGSGVVEASSNLTRSADEWQTVAGIAAQHFERWLGYLSTQHRLVLNPEQRTLHAEELVANGNATAQEEVVKFSIARNSKSLIPIGDVRARKQGMRRQGSGGTDKAAAPRGTADEQLEKLKARRHEAWSHGISMAGFRDPLFAEQPDEYRKAQDAEHARKLNELVERRRKASA